MTKTELLEIITNRENSGVEFKRDTIDNRSLAKELVAFANLQGGQVLLGVDDDGTLVGLTRYDPIDDGANNDQVPRTYQRLEEWVMQACRDKIRPELIPYFEVVHDVEPGRDVAVVRVEQGWGVHHVWHDQHRTYYIRVGTLSREASPEELERLFQQRGAFRLELRPVSGSSLADLDRRRLRDYFERLRGQSVPEERTPLAWQEQVVRDATRLVNELEGQEEGEVEATQLQEQRIREIVASRTQEWIDDAEAEWVRLLTNTEILDDSDNQPATVAGLLLFGTNPNRFLPQGGIDAAAYPQNEKDYTALERQSLRGPMVALRNREGALVESGLVEQAVEFVRRNIAVTAALVDGSSRTERWAYPEEAIREAIVNALVHRDYLLSGTNIELSIYSNRIEIVSPGRLHNGITTERMRIGCRSARNQLLKDVMRDYGYLEHMGMGVPRKIMKLMREQNRTEPDLISDEESFTLRLWKEPSI